MPPKQIVTNKSTVKKVTNKPQESWTTKTTTTKPSRDTTITNSKQVHAIKKK